MRLFSRLLAFLWLLSLASPLWAADLSKIERVVRKEPVYKSKEPLHCLLVFGPAAKTRIWVVLDGTDLFVDTNGDGDLSAPNKRFPDDGRSFKPFEISDAAGPDRYLVRRIDIDRSLPEFGVVFDIQVDINGKYRQGSTPVRCVPAEHKDQPHGMPLLATEPGRAPICHFHGPLTLRLKTVYGVCNQQLVAGEKPGDLFVYLGTFDAAHGCFVTVRTNWREKLGDKFVDRLFPVDVDPMVHPVADVEFPAKEPGGKLVRARYELSQRC
jgi:hypothetical protein